MKLLFTDNVSESGFKEIQILRTATIYDARYGEVTITKDMLDQMVVNFDEKVRGIELILDAGHNSDKEAYGWFKRLSVKLGEDGQHELWAMVELTSFGQRALTEKHYGYISADFEMSYVDNETLKNHGTVLMGAALTNRPVIKRMKSAIELSENKKMELPELLQSMGVASAEELVALVSELRSKSESSELELATAKEAIALADKNNSFNVMMTEGKVVEAQRKAFTEGNMFEFAKNAATVKLETITHSNANGDQDDVSAQVKIMELAEAKMKTEKLSMTKAISLVLSENKELNEQYQSEMNTKGRK